MDKFSIQLGFNTRVVAIFYDKKEYAEEIDRMKRLASEASDRYNLRIGLVTD